MMRNTALLVLAAIPLLLGCGDSSDEATIFEVVIENTTQPTSFTAADGSPLVIGFAGALWAVHGEINSIYTASAPAPSNGLEAFAEDGNPGTLIESLVSENGVELVGLVSETVTNEGTLGPGQQYRFLISAPQGKRLSLATTFLQGNDIFLSTPDVGIPLFDEGGSARSGDITGEFALYDAGTEVNEAPGLGANQVVRQSAANTGASESGVVQPVNDGFVYPSVTSMVRITINPTDEVSF